MIEMKDVNKTFDVLDEMLKSTDIDSSILRKLDNDGDHTIELALAYIFETFQNTRKIDVPNISNPSEYIYSRRIMMTNVFNTLAYDIHDKFYRYIINNLIQITQKDDYYDDGYRFGPCFPNNIRSYYNNYVYNIDTCDILSYASNYIRRSNIYDIAYTISLEYYRSLMSNPYYNSKIRSIDFNGILTSYVRILDILGVIATFVYSTTMFPEISISLPQKNLIDNKDEDRNFTVTRLE